MRVEINGASVEYFISKSDYDEVVDSILHGQLRHTAEPYSGLNISKELAQDIVDEVLNILDIIRK
jgi:hypothetical protein